MSGVDVVTFGCRLNIFESEVMRRHASEAGLDDLVIVHTCAVTAEAERQARQAIRRARRARPEARIVATGCAVQIRPEAYAGLAEVDHLVGNDTKLRPETWRGLARPDPAAPSVGDIMALERTSGQMVEGFEQHTRAFVQVQDGCDHRCTFCVIPYGRGNSRSVPEADVLAQIRKLVEAGYKEVVLTGVDLTSYGKELAGRPPLGRLVGRILEEVPALPRLRLSSLDPAEIDAELFAHLTREPRVMPHVHLSVQAGDDMILKRMKRRHLRQDVVDLCSRLRAVRPGIVFGADLIAGFPTEDEAMFERTSAMVDEAGLTYLHVFPYSPRPGTPAARMPQLAKGLIKERAARLRARGEAALDRFLEGEVGGRRRVLVERGNRGHTEEFAPIRLIEPVAAGTLAEVAVTGVDGGLLVGRIQETPTEIGVASA